MAIIGEGYLVNKEVNGNQTHIYAGLPMARLVAGT